MLYRSTTNSTNSSSRLLDSTSSLPASPPIHTSWSCYHRGKLRYNVLGSTWWRQGTNSLTSTTLLDENERKRIQSDRMGVTGSAMTTSDLGIRDAELVGRFDINCRACLVRGICIYIYEGAGAKGFWIGFVLLIAVNRMWCMYIPYSVINCHSPNPFMHRLPPTPTWILVPASDFYFCVLILLQIVFNDWFIAYVFLTGLSQITPDLPAVSHVIHVTSSGNEIFICISQQVFPLFFSFAQNPKHLNDKPSISTSNSAFRLLISKLSSFAMSPSQGSYFDIEALSGIFGWVISPDALTFLVPSQGLTRSISSMSIACWVVVFSPQIVENFRRSSADGLSLTFLVVWLLGDIFNILGAVLQGVLPTITILAVYYTVADMVLLGQCFYYRGFTFSDKPATVDPSAGDQETLEDDATEESPLLWRETSKDANYYPRPVGAGTRSVDAIPEYSSSSVSIKHVDATHLSPTAPIVPISSPINSSQSSTIRSILYNTSALLLVCLVGITGWYLSSRYPETRETPSHGSIHFNIWGQTFGYLCAIFYLGSRIPQILLNQRRKSTDGVSILFFLFACVGNLTFILSIFAYEPSCARLEGGSGGGRGDCEKGEWGRGYGRYVLANASWIIGSAGTLILDLAIFGQFWLYRGAKGTAGAF